MSVRQCAGQVASTSTPRRPSPVSCARLRVRAFTAALATRYGARPPAVPGPLIRPRQAESVTTRPHRRSTMPGTNVDTAWNTPSRSVDITRRHSASSVRSVFDIGALITAAEQTSTSTAASGPSRPGSARTAAGVGDVGVDPDRVEALGDQDLGGRRSTVGVAAVHHHGGPGPAQPAGDLQPDPPAAAGHQRDASLELTGHPDQPATPAASGAPVGTLRPPGRGSASRRPRRPGR